jgi:hypothetical protein
MHHDDQGQLSSRSKIVLKIERTGVAVVVSIARGRAVRCAAAWTSGNYRFSYTWARLEARWAIRLDS